MRRSWIAMLLLAGSWIFGLSYYHAAIWPLWSACVVAGTILLLKDAPPPRPPRTLSLVTAVLLIPAIAWLAWPYKAAAILILAGIALTAPAIPRDWPARLGTAALESGVVLLSQAVALQTYARLTARAHELPAALGYALELVTRLFGIDTAYNGAELALFAMRKTHMLAATWELLLDPLSLTFAVGGLLLLLMRRAGFTRVASFTVIMLLWLPLRAVLLIAILLHRTLLTDYDAALHLMNQFWSQGVLAALLVPPVVALMTLVAPSARPSRRQTTQDLVTVDAQEPQAAPPPCPPLLPGRASIGLVLAGLAAATLAAGLLWDPVGERKPGRIMVDEYHSTWEPTQRPFDTTWYGHKAGYNYACIYDYCSRFYGMSRITNTIDDATLDGCDVLILKVPTEAYSAKEVDCITRFVEQGGGILLIGEHTDVYLTGTHLNQIAAPFGFTFRSDCLFGIDSPFEQYYVPPRVPHPILRHMPPLDFAVSCSIEPTSWSGRDVIRSTGLWHLPADYHAGNFYPQVEDRADARYGAFIQLWTTRHARGRVAAFTDSTIFSNFSTFEPGKAELMLGMLEWLNHRNRIGDPRPWLLGLAAVFALLAFASSLGAHGLAPAFAAALMFGWCLAGLAINAYGHRAFPSPKMQRPATLVKIDRTVCDAPLSKSGFIKATPEGFGIFEQFILKLGYFLARTSGDAVFDGNLAVFFHPNQRVDDTFKSNLVAYVESGGHALIVDSCINKKSSANSLLKPFGMSFESYGPDESGSLVTPEGWPLVTAEAVRVVKDGTPFVTLNGKPVAAWSRRGKGTMTVIGFGARFNDDNMGITADIEPDDELRTVYELEFTLLRAIVNETLPAPPAESPQH